METRTKALAVALGALSLFGLLVAWFGPSEPPTRIPSAAVGFAEARDESAAERPVTAVPEGG